MRDWDKLRVFYFVAKAKSFTKAGEALRLCQPAISRSVMLLEYRLKVKLFVRLPRGLDLTPQGEILFEAVDKAFACFKDAQVQFHECDKVQGTMTLVTSASAWLLPYITGFLDVYPDVRFQIIEQTGRWSLEDADAGICPLMKGKDIVQKPLVTLPFQFYAHFDYLEAEGTPGSVEELKRRRLLLPHPDAWPLEGVGRLPRPYIRMSSLEGLKALAEQGAGIALLPCVYAEASEFEPLSLDMEAPTVTLYYSYMKALGGSKRVKALGEYLEERAGG